MRKRIAIVSIGVVVAIVGLIDSGFSSEPYLFDRGAAIYAVGTAMVVFGWPYREYRKRRR